MAIAIKEALPASCEVHIPSPDEDVKVYLGDRLMQTGDSSLPAAVVVPSNEGDIVAVTKLAREHGFNILPKGGGVSAFSVLNQKSLYMDLKKFNRIEYDSALETVTVGGGARWKQVMDAIIPQGYYTG